MWEVLLRAGGAMGYRLSAALRTALPSSLILVIFLDYPGRRSLSCPCIITSSQNLHKTSSLRCNHTCPHTSLRSFHDVLLTHSDRTKLEAKTTNRVSIYADLGSELLGYDYELNISVHFNLRIVPHSPLHSHAYPPHPTHLITTTDPYPHLTCT